MLRHMHDKLHQKPRRQSSNSRMLVMISVLLIGLAFVKHGFDYVLENNNANNGIETTASLRKSSSSTSSSSSTTTIADKWKYPGQNRVLMATYVFGSEYVNQRRFQMFVKTAATSGVDIAILGDAKPTYELPKNVAHIYITWNDLIDRLLDKVFDGGKNIDAATIHTLKHGNPYKVCDFRPLFGYLFPEIVTNHYEWWGHLDNDVVLGNLTAFFPDTLRQYKDILVGDGHWAWGPFTMYRNTPHINTLFWKIQKHASLESILLNATYLGFDEWGIVPGGVTKESTWAGLLEEHAVELVLKRATINAKLWDMGECDNVEWIKQDPTWQFLDDPNKENCGECIWNEHPTDGKMLTRTRDGQEMFMCHYQRSKRWHEATLQDDHKFQQLLQADKFRITFKHGYDLVED